MSSRRWLSFSGCSSNLAQRSMTDAQRGSALMRIERRCRSAAGIAQKKWP
jgi:hypothetical protein